MAKQQAIVLSGDEVLSRALALGAADTARIVGQALMEEARLVMRDSLEEVPVLDGFLKASNEVLPPKFSYGFVKITMGYGGAAAAYALYVHNTPYEFNWTRTGSKSHFLSDPLAAAVPRISKNLSARIGRIMGR